MGRSILIRNARVLDVRSGEYTENDVLSLDGYVMEVSKHIPTQPNIDELDVRGNYLLPGFIDSHVHVKALNAQLGSQDGMPHSYVAAHAIRNMGKMLRRGFTTIRDCGGADSGLAAGQREGTIQGPRLFFGGHVISQTGGHADYRLPGEHHRVTDPYCCAGSSRVADGVTGVRVAARDEIRQGASHIKIMASGGISSTTGVDTTQFSEQEVLAVVEEASAANRYVAAHAYTSKAVDRCLSLGVRTIEHGSLIGQSSIDLLIQYDAFLVPTLVTHWAMVEVGRDYGVSNDAWAKSVQVWEAGLEALKLATQNNVQIAYGSDLLGEMQRFQSQEFELRSRVQDNLAVIQSATVNGARLLQQEGKLGEVQEGVFADFNIVDSDPLENIGVLTNVERHLQHVIQAGMIIS